ncbi:MAG: TrbC/VirB2 family protein [Rickettsiaceae bacterium H1]|nr:TrbC/VirB2 family protein [Rickettsiaceae bacterium H1]
MHNSIFHYQFFNRIFYSLLIISISILLPDIMFATGSVTTPSAQQQGDIAETICRVIQQLTGPIGQAISTVAVIFIGIGLFMGKISWGLALGIAAGMGMLFGAQNVVQWVSGQSVSC